MPLILVCTCHFATLWLLTFSLLKLCFELFFFLTLLIVHGYKKSPENLFPGLPSYSFVFLIAVIVNIFRCACVQQLDVEYKD